MSFEFLVEYILLPYTPSLSPNTILLKGEKVLCLMFIFIKKSCEVFEKG